MYWLRERHPQILFAYDAYTPDTDLRQTPNNMQVFNFHYYFMWGKLYHHLLEREFSLLVEKPVSKVEIRVLADSDYFPDDDWYHRILYYTNLDPAKLPQAAEKITTYLREHIDEFRANFRNGMAKLENYLNNHLPQVSVICGEGVTYSSGNELVWEEYWQMVREMMKAYRDLGLQGTVVRTCCGPEVPCWTLCPDKLLEMNNLFLYEENRRILSA